MGRDHGDAVATVGLVDVRDDLVAALPAQVDVEVGAVAPLRVQEALEAEPVAQRVHVRDAEHVGHDRGGARAATHGGDALRAGKGDDLGDQQEVVGEAESLDDRKLLVQSCAGRADAGGGAAVASRQAGRWRNRAVAPE